MVEKKGGRSSAFDQIEWSLHRNSILLSSISLISCATHAQIDSIFSIPIPVEVSDSLPFLTWIAATYAIIAFFFEWRTGPAEALQNEIDGLGDFTRQITSRFDDSDQKMAILEESVQQTMSGVSTAFNELKAASTQFAASHQTYELGEGQKNWNFTQTLSNRFSEIMREIESTSTSNAGDPTLMHRATRMQEEAFRHFVEEQVHGQSLHQIRSSIANAVPRFGAGVDAIQRNGSRIEGALADHRNYIREISRNIYPISEAINRQKSYKSFKVYLTGLGAPLVLYVICTSHFIGLYFSFLPSIFELLRSP